MTALESFLESVKQGRPRVLELGTKRSIPDRPTHHKVWVPNASEFLMTDIEAGADVTSFATRTYWEILGCPNSMR